MKNNFVENIKDEKYFYSLIDDIDNSKVGFYSVGLYPASLAYNCAMHGKSNNILLAPREDRDLLGAFSNDVISDMDNVAEGVMTAPVVSELAKEHEVETPITDQVSAVVSGSISPLDAYELLMLRDQGSET